MKIPKIIPGHGRPSTRRELETYLTMLEDIKAKVQTQIDAGKTLEEVKADKVLTRRIRCIVRERLHQPGTHAGDFLQ